MSANNWFDLAQTIILSLGALFTIRQLQLTVSQITIAAEATKAAAQQAEFAAKASHASAISSIANEGSEILWRVLEDPSLHRLFDDTAPVTGVGPDKKLALVRGVLIRHFANSFQLRQLGHVGDSLWAAYKADMTTFFRNKSTEERWDALKKFYEPSFRDFVDRELLNRT